MSSIAKLNAFNSLKNFFKNIFADDLEDENSGLDKYINNENDIEKANIARELKESLRVIELSQEELENPKKRGNISLNSRSLKLKSEKASKIEHIKDDDDKDLSK